MRLTEIERESLLAAQLRADAPISEIARHAKRREHVVRRALSRLTDRGVIQRYAYFNHPLLGIKNYMLFFALAGSPQERRQLLDEIAAQRNVIWLAEVTGEFHYCLSAAVRQSSEMLEVLDSLAERAGQFYDKAISEHITGALFSREYLSLSPRPSASLEYSSAAEKPAEVDELDRTIMQGLSSYPNASFSGLARKLGIPPATVKFRIRKLRDSKVLLGFCYAVNSSHFGMQSFNFLVYAKGIDKELNNALYLFCREHPNIYACMRCLGSWDFEFKAELLSATDASALVSELYARFPGRINTVKVLTLANRARKVSWYPF